MPRIHGPQTLLIDADDTLWENNIYFDRAIADFICFLDHKQHSAEEVHARLVEIERGCVVKHGYGLASFCSALVETFEHFSVDPVTPELHRTISRFAWRIAEQEVQLLPGVAETLAALAGTHHLIVMTKGAISEQMGKVERSGVKQYFAAFEVVAEKNAMAYRTIVEKYQLDPGATWMVGNSPKSDINPALTAGLHTIFIPHARTWVLEHEGLIEPPTPQQRLLVAERFPDLLQIFQPQMNTGKHG